MDCFGPKGIARLYCDKVGATQGLHPLVARPSYTPRVGVFLREANPPTFSTVDPRNLD